MRSLRSPRVLALLPRRDLPPQLFVWEDFFSLPTSASTPARVTCSGTTRAPRAAPTPLHRCTPLALPVRSSALSPLRRLPSPLRTCAARSCAMICSTLAHVGSNALSAARGAVCRPRRPGSAAARRGAPLISCAAVSSCFTRLFYVHNIYYLLVVFVRFILCCTDCT